jgi:hypothetical protein
MEEEPAASLLEALRAEMAVLYEGTRQSAR